MRMMMMIRMRRMRKRKTERETEEERETPNTHAQSVACADVQAGAKKSACRFSTHRKKLAQRLDSLVRRSEKKKRVHVARKWQPLARTHAKHL